ncbi:MAG: hypothetical protein Q7S80_00130 [bacterium]|nr:hypothetical protein [bacterium]
MQRKGHSDLKELDGVPRRSAQAALNMITDLERMHNSGRAVITAVVVATLDRCQHQRCTSGTGHRPAISLLESICADNPDREVQLYVKIDDEVPAAA